MMIEKNIIPKLSFSIQTPTFRDITNIITDIISLYSTECTQTVGTVGSRPEIFEIVGTIPPSWCF